MGSNTPKEVDLIIKRGLCVTSDPDHPTHTSGSIAVSSGTIVAVGCDEIVATNYYSGNVIDADGAIVHAGFIDPHVHLTSAAFHAFDLDALASSGPTYVDLKCATDDDITAALSSAFAVAMLRKGYTLFSEAGTVFETDAMADAVAGCGVRALVSAPYAWDELSVMRVSSRGLIPEKMLNRAPPDFATSIEALERELGRNSDPKNLVQGFVCIYGEGCCSDELTIAAKNLARQHDTIFNQHLGYLADAYAAEYQQQGESGVRRLQRLEVLDNLTTLTHLNAISAADADIIVADGVNVIWCPLSVLQRALFVNSEVQQIGLFRRGVPVAIAVDTLLSFPLGSPAIAASLLAGALRQPLSNSDILSMQTLDAARCLGQDARLGSLSVGKKADIVVRAKGDITQSPAGIADNLLGISGATIPVDTVVIDGKIVMREGAATLVDEHTVLAKALVERQRLLQRAGF
ncbi:MAG: hypothetical protein E5W19_10255 [Mesorhizobium sp.]|nr:MAG: hypothetical protein E5W19_10255 [Mesorhizobium sp.]